MSNLKPRTDMNISIETYKDRLEDWRRHLTDLRDLTYEGQVERDEREATFRQAVELLSPVVHDVLEEFNSVMLAGTGSIEWRPVQSDGSDGLVSMWLLWWSEQRAAKRRTGGVLAKEEEPTQPPVLKDTSPEGIDPIIVRAFMPKQGVVGWLHGHISGGYTSPNSMWPLNVTSPEDAARQTVVLWMIAEGEFHRCTYELARAASTLLPGGVESE